MKYKPVSCGRDLASVSDLSSFMESAGRDGYGSP